MKIFSVDSPVFKFFDRLWDLIKLNFFWLICSIPVVTIGASTAAAFSITLHMADDTEGYIVKPFFKAFRSNLKKGIPVGLIFAAGIYAAYIYIQIITKAEKYEGILLALGIIFAVLFFCGFVYTFALMARYENSIIGTFINSYRISIRYFGRTALLALLIALETVLFIWNNVLIAIGLLIAPACIMLTISGFALKIFKELEKQPGAVTNPEKIEEMSVEDKQDGTEFRDRNSDTMETTEKSGDNGGLKGV